VHANLLAIPVFLNVAWCLECPEFHADPVTIGLLAATLFACFGISSVPFGLLADLRAPAKLLLVSVIGIAISLAAMAVSPTLPWLALSVAALGLSSGIYHPTALSAISRSVEAQGRGMGWHGMGGSLGIALGPAFVGTALAAGWPWRTAAGLLIFPSLLGVAWLVAGRLPVSRAAPSEELRQALHSLGTMGHSLTPLAYLFAGIRSLRTLGYGRTLLVYFFAGIAYQGSLTFLPKFVGPGLFALALGLGAVGQVIAGNLADRRRPDRILFTLSLVGAGLLILLAAVGPSIAFLIGALGFGFVLFSLEALQNTLVSRVAPRAWRGLAFGFSFLSVFGLGSIGAVLAGWLIGRGQASLLFVALGAALAASGLAAYGVGASGPKGGAD
jgi:MFS family permease